MSDEWTSEWDEYMNAAYDNLKQEALSLLYELTGAKYKSMDELSRESLEYWLTHFAGILVAENTPLRNYRGLLEYAEAQDATESCDTYGPDH